MDRSDTFDPLLSGDLKHCCVMLHLSSPKINKHVLLKLFFSEYCQDFTYDSIAFVFVYSCGSEPNGRRSPTKTYATKGHHPTRGTAKSKHLLLGVFGTIFACLVPDSKVIRTTLPFYQLHWLR